MEIRVTTKIGGVVYQFLIDEKKDMETLHRAAVLGNPPCYCHECKNSEHFKLDSSKDKEGNIYVSVRCKKCGASAKLGQYKAGGYFWHKFEQYKKKGEQTTQDMPGDDDQAPWEE